MTLAEIFSYASQNVKKMASSLNRVQHPQMVGDGSRVITKKTISNLGREKNIFGD